MHCGVEYRLKYKADENFQLRENYACYNRFYRNLYNIETVQVFFVKKWSNALTEEEILSFLGYLKKMKFKFTYRNTEEEWIFEIKPEKNSMLVNKILLNCFRFLYAENFPDIVKTFLKFVKNKQKQPLWNILLLSTYVDTRSNSNHSFNPYIGVRLVTLQEFQEKILKASTNEHIRHYIEHEFGLPGQDKYNNCKQKYIDAVKNSKNCKELLNEIL